MNNTLKTELIQILEKSYNKFRTLFQIKMVTQDKNLRKATRIYLTEGPQYTKHYLTKIYPQKTSDQISQILNEIQQYTDLV